MERKPTRLSGTSYAVLSLIGFLGEATPYDLKQAMAQSIENFWPVPHTTFYAEPTRLAEGGYLSERQEQHGRRRKLYALTDAGRAALDAWLAEPGAAPPELRDEMILKIFAGADPGPLMRQRMAWHVEKLAWLSQHGIANQFGLADHDGPITAWLGGVNYHSGTVRALEEALASAESGQLRAVIAQLREAAEPTPPAPGGEPAPAAEGEGDAA